MRYCLTCGRSVVDAAGAGFDRDGCTVFVIAYADHLKSLRGFAFGPFAQLGLELFGAGKTGLEVVRQGLCELVGGYAHGLAHIL